MLISIGAASFSTKTPNLSKSAESTETNISASGGISLMMSSLPGRKEKLAGTSSGNDDETFLPIVLNAHVMPSTEPTASPSGLS